jgi:hypothetical protein
MKILNASVLVGGIFQQFDVLETEDGNWLVPGWLKAEGWMTPIRMIRLDTLPHQRLSTGDFVLDAAIPQSVLEGLTLPEEALSYEVIFLPNIRVPIPSSTD